MQDFATYMKKGHEVAECIVSDYIQAIDGMTPFFVSYEKLPQLVHTMCEHGANDNRLRPSQSCRPHAICRRTELQCHGERTSARRYNKVKVRGLIPFCCKYPSSYTKMKRMSSGS